MSETVYETDTQTVTDSGDHDRFAHFVEKGEAIESMVNGTPVIALCGKVWVPSRDPEKYKICPTCKEIYDEFGGK
jgi:hypothetical protein